MADTKRKQIISEPSVIQLYNGFSYSWSVGNEVCFMARIDHLDQDSKSSLTGELSIEHMFEFAPKLSNHRFNLLSTQARHSITKRLESLQLPYDINWPDMVERICSMTIQGYRQQDAGTEENINLDPSTMKVEYLLQPIIPFDVPVTIYTAGGKGKSVFADYFAVLVQFGYCSSGNLPFIPRKGNVLYLDWEADAETHRRYIKAIKKGLGIDDIEGILYKRLDHPLVEAQDAIRPLIKARDISLVILDSQMAATASGTRGLTEAQVASEYYNVLRSFNCATLTIDHITKQSMNEDNGTGAPYGSVVKYNRSRSQFELRLPDEDDDSDHKEYALVHRKFNLGRRLKPLGITVDYENIDNELVSISFSACKIGDNPNLNKVRSRRDRLIEALRKLGKATIKELSTEVGEPENSEKIGVQLANDKRTFFRVSDGVYGLLPLPPDT